MDYNKFHKRILKQNSLSENCKTDKFVLLFYRMYEYTLSIPKDEIILKLIINREDYFNSILGYILRFLEAKDFYNWKDRLYKLYTIKFKKQQDKFLVLYGNKGIEFYNNYLEAQKNTFREHYGCDYGFQSKEVQDKIKENYLTKHGCENPFQDEEVKDKIKKRNLERRGVEYASQDPEVKAKIVATMIERWGVTNNLKLPGIKEKAIKNSHSKEAKQKRKATCMRIYKHTFSNYKDFCYSNHSNYSNIANEFCTSLYSMLPENIECVFFAKDHKEYSIENKYYDFCIPDLKIIIEFDGLYWHGLIEGQKYVRDIPVEDVWNRDKEKTKLAESMGFKVIRVREDEYRKNKEYILNSIVEEIKNVAR